MLINSAVGYVSAYVLNLRLYIFLNHDYTYFILESLFFIQLICGSNHHESFLERSLRQAMSLRFLSLSLFAATAAVLMTLARETRACACSIQTNIRWTRFHWLCTQTQKHKNRQRDGRWHRRRHRHTCSLLWRSITASFASSCPRYLPPGSHPGHSMGALYMRVRREYNKPKSQKSSLFLSVHYFSSLDQYQK